MSCHALLPGGIGEGGAAGLLADRLGGLAVVLDGVHLRLDRGALGRWSGEDRLGEDQVSGAAE